MEDFERYRACFDTPVSGNYRGIDVFKCGPWSQGPVLLQQLNLLEGFDLTAQGHNSEEYIHTLIECAKLAFADREHYYADPDFVDVPMKELLSDNYAKAQRKRLDPTKAAQGRVRYGKPMEWSKNPDLARTNGPEPLSSLPVTVAQSVRHAMYQGATTHVVVADSMGNVFSFTHTLGTIFGGHDLLGKTGVLGSNSMDWFDLDTNIWSGEPSNLVLEPRKRNRFTLCPGMVFKDGKPYIAIGGSAAETTMPGVAQVILNMLEFDLDPQAAIEAPRVIYGDVLHHTGGTRLGLDAEIRDQELPFQEQ